MTVLVVDSDWMSLRSAANEITRKNVAVTVILKSSAQAAEQFAMYNAVDMVFVRSGMFSEELCRKIRSLQPLAECHILGPGQDITPFLFPYML